MKRFLSATGVFALVCASVVVAQDVKPAQPAPAKGIQLQPKAIQIQPAQPGAVVTRATAAKMAQLEEDYETTEAQRDVRRAHVRAAEVAVKAAEMHLELVGKVGANVVPQTELVKAKLDVEAAKAQLDIRMAELKEIEVRVKYAKKRLDDAKAGGVPAAKLPRVNPKQVDPPPPSNR